MTMLFDDFILTLFKTSPGMSSHSLGSSMSSYYPQMGAVPMAAHQYQGRKESIPAISSNLTIFQQQLFHRHEQHVRDGNGWEWDGLALSAPDIQLVKQLPLQQVRPHLPQVWLGCTQVRPVVSLLKQVRPDKQVRLVQSSPSSTSTHANLNGSRSNCLIYPKNYPKTNQCKATLSSVRGKFSCPTWGVKKKLTQKTLRGVFRDKLQSKAKSWNVHKQKSSKLNNWICLIIAPAL